MLASPNAVSNAHSVPSALMVTVDHLLLLPNVSQCGNQNGQAEPSLLKYDLLLVG